MMSSAQTPLPSTAGVLGVPPGYYVKNGNPQPKLQPENLPQAANSYGHNTTRHEQARDFSTTNTNTYSVNGNTHPVPYDPNDSLLQHDNTMKREFSSAPISTDSEGGYVHDDDENGGDYLGEAHLHDDEVDHLNEYGEYSGGNVEEAPVKLFVGQVPKSLEEESMYPIFSQFGPIEKVNIIRDRQTGHHRGCAFVTFSNKADAEACELAFHNKYILPDGKRPVQIRPASANESESKIFVGMLPRELRESDVREIFEPYGDISSVFMVRRTDAMKKGCAFVKYNHRGSAVAAIEAVNNATFEGFDRPLIVKFADNRTKHVKQTQGRHFPPVMPHHAAHSISGSVISHGSHSPSPAGSPYFIPSHATPLHVYPGHSTPPPMSLSPQLHTSGRPSQYGNMAQYPTSYASSHGSLTPPPPTMLATYGYPMTHAYTNQGNVIFSSQTVNGPNLNSTRSLPVHPHPMMTMEASDPTGLKPLEGPAGANLFIYHLPHDLTDADLATAFNPFGNVLSAKVYMDKNTGESKGFGFVSYDSVISAENAIEQMNGFQIGNKRLKVQHKRVHHRPPLSVSTGNYAYYASSPIHTMAMPDIHPSMEMYTLSEDGSIHGLDNHGQLDMLTRSFGTL